MTAQETLSRTATLRVEADHLRAENARLRAQVAQLEAALNSRIVIDQAVGILAEKRHVAVSEAFTLLRDHCRSHHQPLHAAAGVIVADQERLAS